MNELMLEADLAIATGGQTLYELARMGIPTIAVMVSDNQANDIAGWEQAGFLRYAGTPSDIDMEDRLVFSLRQFESYDTRLECSRLGRSHIDGNGARRIARILSELI
jgi:spore coat polysaccharide biosynthesis predicted glycosyltransferase SpsG